MKHKFTIVGRLAFILSAMFLLCLNVSAQVRISQVYGGGGNSGATHTHDFVELFNAGTSSVSLAGWAIQYASGTGSTYSTANLSGSIPANSYFLIQMGSGGAVGAALPTPNVSATGINMSATLGKVFLTNTTTTLTTTCPSSAAIVDFVGFGSTASCFEGTAPAPAGSNSLAVTRLNSGCTDSNQNSTNFAAQTPNPRNTSSPTFTCGAIATVTTTAASAITATSATLNGIVNPNNATTTPQFQYGITPSIATVATTTTPTSLSGTIAAGVSAPLTPLLPNTNYSFRVSATNSFGTANGVTLTFNTLAETPNAPTVSNPSPITLDVAITADNNSSSTQYAIQEVASGNYVQADGSLAPATVWQTSSAWGTKIVTGLNPSTTYNFRVKARNADNVETAFSPNGSGTTLTAAIPVILITSSFTSFTTTVGSASATQTYNVTGTNLTDDIIITASSDFQVSSDGSNWFSSVTYAQSGGSVNATVSVRMNPTVAGPIAGTLTHTSTGASTQIANVSGLAIAAEPTLASAVTFGTTSGISMVINFNGGNGSSRIVVVREGNPVTFVPTDQVAATGVSSTFTSAVDQGSGNRIVYDGNGNSVIVNGLNPLTQYFVAVYEYNGSSNFINYFTTAGTGNNTTISAEPTAAGTITVSSVNTDSIVVNFSGGNGAGRMLVVSASTAVTFAPTDAVTYTGANDDFNLAFDLGSGNKFIYIGSGTTATLKGVAIGTTYHFALYQYNGSGTNINYLTTASTVSTTTPGPVNYSLSGSTYSQNFNTLPSSGSFTVPTPGPNYTGSTPVNAGSSVGWQYGSLSGTTRFIVGDGSGATPTGGTYSMGTTSNSDRALGVFASSSSTSMFGVIIRNNTSEVLQNVSISFTGEQWRRGNGLSNALTFQYTLNGTDISTGTYTIVPELTFNSPNISATANSALNGNDPANRTAISYSFTLNQNWLPGQVLVLRWTDSNDPSDDDFIGIDDFSFIATAPQAPATQDNNLSFTNISTTSLTANWLNGDGANRIVVMNTSNSFTNPVDGTTYTANPVYGGGEQVVFNGSGSTVNVSNLVAGTTYHFRVYGYNGTSLATKYNLSPATLNPNSVTTVAPAPPTEIVVTSVNGITPVQTNQPFYVVIQTRDAAGNPQNVTTSTTIDLTVFSGLGNLGGTTSGTLAPGNSILTINGVTYDAADFGVQLDAADNASVLTSGQSAPFDVFDPASQLAFTTVPVGAIVNTTLSSIIVQARRPDNSVDPLYNGPVTIAVATGPGSISAGTTTVNAMNGIATFTGIQFNQAGTYTLTATSGTLTPATSGPIYITNTPSFTELVIPRFVGSKSSTTDNLQRTPIALCFRIDNLFPNTAYDLRAAIEESAVANSYGGGNIWNGTAFSGNSITNAFTTDVNGSSGPVWIFVQPATSRFEPGVAHTLRVGYIATGTGPLPTTPLFVGSKIIRALDITSAGRTTDLTDDGAFVRGNANACAGGRFVLLYDNETGTGDPLYSYQIRTTTPTNTSQSGLPASINEVFAQTSPSVVGDYAAVIPTGANNANGVRRIETRNASNVVVAAATDGDGVWPSGANTTNITRRSIAAITASDASLNSITSLSTTSTPASCAGVFDGSATATATGFGAISYSWNTSPVQATATATNISSGIYTVTATDAATGCTATATASVGQPSFSTITPGGPTTFCDGGSVTLTAGPAVSYLWSNGLTTQSINVTESGSYTVTADNGSGCIQTSLPVNVVENTFEFATTLYSENVGVPASSPISLATYSGFQNTSPITYTSTSSSLVDVRNTQVSSGYVNSSGDGNFFFGSGAGAAAARNLIISGINTSGFSGLTLSFGLKRDAASTDPMLVDVSTDGTNWSPLTITTPSNLSWTLVTATGTIPATSNLRVRFSKNSTSASFRLDDIRITGTANAITVSASGPTILCPGASVQLSSNIPTGNTWSPGGQTTRSITVNTAGSYSVSVMGTNGCPGTSSAVTVQTVTAPSVEVITTNLQCSGTNIGTATANVTDGTTPYNYSWNTSPVQTTQLISSLAAGSYTVTVTDANNCIATATGTVTSPSAVVATVSATSIACNGGQSTVTVSATGGTSPYTGTGTFNEVAGSYTYTVIDGFGCTATTSTTITQPAALTATASATPILCNGNTSTVTVSATGGTGSYTGTGTFSVNAGTYNYTVTDANGCTSVTSVTITEPATALTASAFATDILCNGSSSLVTVSATGGTGTITGTGSFTVSAGTYNYTVTDANGCTAVTSVTITEPSAVIASATATTILCNGSTSTVTVTGSGGTSPLTGTGTFTVNAGTYNYTVIDANGCIGTTSITITQPAARVISGFNPTSGCAGDTIVISGSNFTGVTTVEIGTMAATHTVVNDTVIRMIIPTGAVTATVTIGDANGCEVTSTGSVTVNSCAGIAATIKVIIEGYAVGSRDNFGSIDGAMDNGGTGGLLNLLGYSTDPTDVDTIRVSLMDANFPHDLIEEQYGILKTNGDCQINFTSAPGSYFIKVNHRNSVEMWSAAPVTATSTMTYDFTGSASQGYGSQQVEVYPGFFAMYSGDISDAGTVTVGIQDGIVESQDYADMENANSVTSSGYVPEDISGDGIVESTDYAIMESNNYFTIFILRP